MFKNSSIISKSPEIMGGTPVFAGTRVLLETLFDYLKAGEAIDDFLDGFPSVTKEQVIELLEEMGTQIICVVAKNEDSFGLMCQPIIQYYSAFQIDKSHRPYSGLSK